MDILVAGERRRTTSPYNIAQYSQLVNDDNAQGMEGGGADGSFLTLQIDALSRTN